MGFGSRKGLTKGHRGELENFDAVVNEALLEDLQAMVSELKGGIRLMEMRKSRLLTDDARAVADGVDQTWFGVLGHSMWSSSSHNTVGEIHAIMRENAIWLMQQRANALEADSDLMVSMWSICDSDDFYVLIKRFVGPNGIELRAEIHGPDNMVEGPEDTANNALTETLDEVHADLEKRVTGGNEENPTGPSALSLEEQRHFQERIENADDEGKLGYFKTAVGLETSTGGPIPRTGSRYGSVGRWRPHRLASRLVGSPGIVGVR